MQLHKHSSGKIVTYFALIFLINIVDIKKKASSKQILDLQWHGAQVNVPLWEFQPFLSANCPTEHSSH